MAKTATAVKNVSKTLISKIKNESSKTLRLTGVREASDVQEPKPSADPKITCSNASSQVFASSNIEKSESNASLIPWKPFFRVIPRINNPISTETG